MREINVSRLVFWAGVWAIAYHFGGVLGLGVNLILSAIVIGWAEEVLEG